LTLAETAARLGLSDTTLRQMIARGNFPRPVRVGAKKLFFPEADVREYLERQEAARHQEQSKR
jgi:excisionase family DNA binding protein